MNEDWLHEDTAALETHSVIEWNKLQEKSSTIGYKEGIALGMEKGVQQGFDRYVMPFVARGRSYSILNFGPCG